MPLRRSSKNLYLSSFYYPIGVCTDRSYDSLLRSMLILLMSLSWMECSVFKICLSSFTMNSRLTFGTYFWLIRIVESFLTSVDSIDSLLFAIFYRLIFWYDFCLSFSGTIFRFSILIFFCRNSFKD